MIARRDSAGIKKEMEMISIKVRLRGLMCSGFILFLLTLLSQDQLSAQLASPFQMTSQSKVSKSPPSKLDQTLQALQQDVAKVTAKNFGSASPSYSTLSNGLVRVKDGGKVQVYVQLTKADAAEIGSLEATGATIELVSENLSIVQAWVPVGQLSQMGQLQFVQSVRVPDYAITRAGSKTTQGDAILRASELRARGVTGAGVKVGVISDGIGGLASAQASGDLPANVTMVTFAGSGAEGTAMLEIVYDLAPGAQLGFCGPATSLEMITCVNDLANVFKANVIVDDLGFFGEPYFADGPVATAVAAVVAQGIFYTSSAGNEAQEHYEADYLLLNVGTGPFATAHNFGVSAGLANDATMNATLAPGGSVRIFLQWNDEFGHSSNDYDLYLLDSVGNIVANSVAIQDGNDDPIEFVTLTNSGTNSAGFQIVITKFAGVTKRLEMFTSFRGTGQINQYGTPADSIFGHPAVPGVFAAAAIDASDPGNDTIELFSSRGPSTLYFPSLAVRQTPTVTAIDGVPVTGAGGFQTPFFGTSAASPHVAGVAALLKSKSPGVSAADIANALNNTAVDLGTPGQDTTYGRGRIDAIAAANVLPYSITVTNAGTGSGTVTSDQPGINCGSTCTAPYGLGTSVTLTATPMGVSSFGGWSGSTCSGTGTCTVTTDAAVTATFNAPPPPAPGGGGGCTLSRTGGGDSLLLALFLLTLGLWAWRGKQRRARLGVRQTGRK